MILCCELAAVGLNGLCRFGLLLIAACLDNFELTNRLILGVLFCYCVWFLLGGLWL